MSKHRKHKKHGGPQPDNREMYQCDVCKKRFPFDGYLPSLASTPVMFVVLGDVEHRRFTLAVASMDHLEKFNEEKALWFICSDRQCIYKSFLLWREWDKRMQMSAFVMGQMEQEGLLPKRESASPMGEELDSVLRNSAIHRPREAAQSHEEPDEAAVPAKASGEIQ